MGLTKEQENQSPLEAKLGGQRVIGKARRKKKKRNAAGLSKNITPPIRHEHIATAYKPRQNHLPLCTAPSQALEDACLSNRSLVCQNDTARQVNAAQDACMAVPESSTCLNLEHLIALPAHLCSVSTPKNTESSDITETELLVGAKKISDLSHDLCEKLNAFRSNALALYELHRSLACRVRCMQCSKPDAKRLRNTDALQYVDSAEKQIRAFAIKTQDGKTSGCDSLQAQISKLCTHWKTVMEEEEESSSNDVDTEQVEGEWNVISPGELFELYRNLLDAFITERVGDEVGASVDVRDLADSLENAVSGETGGEKMKYHFLATQIADIIKDTSSRDCSRKRFATVLRFVKTADATNLIQLCE